MRRRLATAVLAAAALATAGGAQGPDEAWSTYATEHFRLDCPRAAETFCAALAGRLEPARAAVAAGVGYFPPGTVEIVVADPLAAANGSAWPLLRSPRILIWSTPPPAASLLGHLGDWGELVLVHELVHLAHLTRPSRQPWRSLAERTVWPLGPIRTAAPRWAIEGYATALEGRLTGSGRPHAALRAAVLARFAAAGRLPGYGALSATGDGFLVSSMAYLAGSAFLEWLDARAGDGSFDRLWRRMTAATPRGFDAAFEGVYGERPAALWARFAAETTAAAVARERAAEATRRVGAPMLDLAGATSAPALAPAGDRLALVVRPRRKRPRLVVYETQVDSAELERRAARAARQRERDPLDVEAVESGPPPHRRVATLVAPPGADFASARFLRDGRGLLVALSGFDGRGDRRYDLYQWDGEGAAPRRLTRGAGLVAADPFPDGRRAVAVRTADGTSALVEVDLASGALRPLVGPAGNLLYDNPRLDPAGERLAYLEHRDGRWRVRLRELAGGVERELASPLGGEPLAIAWRHDGSLLYAAVARGDAIEIEALPVAAGTLWHQVTRGAGVALAPEPAPDGATLFYLRLDPDGYDLERIALDAATLQPDAAAAPAPTAVAPAAPPPAAPAPGPPGLPYGWGRAAVAPLFAGFAGSDGGPFEIGIRVGDRLGRFEALAIAGSGGGEAPEGVRVALATRATRVAWTLQAARVEPGDAGGAIEDAGTLRGAELDGRFVGYRGTRHGTLRLDLAGGVARIERRGGARPGATTRALLDLDLAGAFGHGDLTLRPGAGIRLLEPLGDGDEPAWRDARLAAELAHRRARLRVEAERRESTGSSAVVRLGGVPGSLLPPAFAPDRWAHPALPEAALAGERLERLALRLAPGAGPWALFAERFDSGDERLGLVGIEAALALGATPFLDLPALEARAGVARLTDGPLEGETRWWLGLAFPARPAGEARFP